MDLPLLERQNPWWSDPARLDEDFVLAALASQPARWTPRLLRDFRLDRDRVYTLRGPRQVGKTTLAKELIRGLIRDSRVDPRSVFYFSCDLVRRPGDLDDVVDTYLRWQGPYHLPRRYIFLDEVSSVKDWSIAVRALANRGRLKGCTLILTGSHALDVTRQVERLPGRRGESADSKREDPLDKVLLPMKFVEFVETLQGDVRRALQRSRLYECQRRLKALETVLAGTPSPAWSSLLLLQDQLQPLLLEYLMTGGFPRPLNDLRRLGRISAETYELYIRVLTGDLARWGYEERTARELLAAVVEEMGTPLSWRTLATETDLGSHNTVAKYVESLEKTFTLQTVYQLDPRRRRPAPKKHRKVYVADPFMFHAIRAWSLGLGDPYEAAQDHVMNPATRGPLLEGIVADHLARIAAGARPRSVFDAYEHVLFWRSRRGWEVDFVLRTDGRPRALQVTTSRPRPEARRALRAFGGGIVLSEAGGTSTVPLGPFLLLA